MNYKQFDICIILNKSHPFTVIYFICIFSKKDKEFLVITINSFLQTKNGKDIFLVFTDIIITTDDKNNISLEDQQILRNKVEEFRIDYPELFV